MSILTVISLFILGILTLLMGKFLKYSKLVYIPASVFLVLNSIAVARYRDLWMFVSALTLILGNGAFLIIFRKGIWIDLKSKVATVAISVSMFMSAMAFSKILLDVLMTVEEGKFVFELPLCLIILGLVLYLIGFGLLFLRPGCPRPN